MQTAGGDKPESGFAGDVISALGGPQHASNLLAFFFEVCRRSRATAVRPLCAALELHKTDPKMELVLQAIADKSTADLLTSSTIYAFGEQMALDRRVVDLIVALVKLSRGIAVTQDKCDTVQ